MSASGMKVVSDVGDKQLTVIARSSIVTARVYPPLGIARVGNAEDQNDPFADDYVIGPEVVGGPTTLPDGAPATLAADFRTANGSIKRQAARFRIYAELTNGTICELTLAHGVHIEWRVAIANLKAGWYEFNQAMDLPNGIAKDALKRNRSLPIISGGRRSLDIVPTPRRIVGSNQSGLSFVFDDGTFCQKRVYLGELRTDIDGRLLFLGGRGLSAPFRPGISPLTFANNDGWHDDTSDGPVSATIFFADGSAMEAEPGYVAVTPPNYAPGLVGLVTLDDTVKETFIAERWIPAPASTSFTQNVWPIFDRLSSLQWINHGHFVSFGYGSPLCGRDPTVVDRLRDGAVANMTWRKLVFALFRDPGALGQFQEAKIPQIYGDAYGESDMDPSRYLAVTKTQYDHLRRWSDGMFVDDWPGHFPRPPDFAALSPQEQVEQLERAALHDCLGGPFHPGIELTWTMRLKRIWTRPYRLKVIDPEAPARQNYGDVLNPTVCVGPGGPFDGVAAGALTRFLGVPWQTDSTSCNSAADYEPSTFLSMPTFWGARMPDQVLAQANFDRMSAIDGQGLDLQAHKHFGLRVDWLRDVRSVDYYGRLTNMIKEWWQLGMVLPVASAPTSFPSDMRVEQGRHPSSAGSDAKRDLVTAIESLVHPSPVIQSGAAVALAAQTKLAQPPKRRFRQGEI